VQRSTRIGWRLVWGMALLVAGVVPALADWTAPLPGGPRGLREVTLANDGAGGAVARWVGLEGQVYSPWPQVGHVDASGNPASGWSGYCFYPPTPAVDLDVAPDGAGGAIIVTSSDAGLRAYHVLAGGSMDPSWPSSGLSVCGATGNQLAPRAVSDGAGGAFVGWQDLRDGTPTGYLTRIVASGSIASGWPADGQPLGSWPANGDGIPELFADGTGGTIVGLLGTDVRLFRFTGNGSVSAGWPASGLFVTTTAAPPSMPRLAVASDAGAYLAWTVGAGNPLHPGPVRAIRVTSLGSVDARWPADGRVVASGTDAFSDPAIVRDGAGGAYVLWGVRTIDGARSLRGARLADDGSFAPGWAATGIDFLGIGASLALDDFISEWEDPAVFTAGIDNSGGLFIAWDDRGVPGTTQVRVSRFRPDGTRHPGWPGDGCLVPAPTGDGRVRAILGSAADDAFVAWRSITSLPFGSAMLSRVEPDGAVNVALARPSALRITNVSGSPARGALVFACTLPAPTPARLELFDLGGRRLRSRVIEGAVGTCRVVLTGSRELPPGVAFARLSQGRDQQWLRVVIAR
jgi:hypothetical protein